MPDFSARRRYPRFPIKLPILYRLKDPGPARAGVGWTRDLSQGGACLELAEPFEPASHLRVFLRTDEGGLELEAQVAWTGGQGSEAGAVIHGVAFTHLTPDQHNALRDMLVHKGQSRLAGLRVPMELPVTCRLKEKPGPALEGKTGDISRGGLLLRLPEVVPPGTALEVTIPTSRGKIEAEGEIVWVEPSDAQRPGELIRHGLRFTDISWPNQMALGLLLAETP